MTARCFGVKPLVGVDLHVPAHSLAHGLTPQIAERCDGCGRSVPAREIHFDGHSFLCDPCFEIPAKPQCSQEVPHRRAAMLWWKFVALRFLKHHAR